LGQLGVNVTGGRHGFWFPNTYTGPTSITAGTLLVGVNNAVPSGSAVTVNGPWAVLAMGGYSDCVTSVSLQGNGFITGPGTLASKTAFDMQSGSVSAVLADNGSSWHIGLNKTTGGLVTLSAVNTYTGPTSITGGTLRVNGSLAAGSAVTVSTGGTLGGSGSIFGPVTLNGGNLSPGSSPGTMTLGSLTFTGSADNYIVEIVSPSSYDNVIFETTIDLAGIGATLGANLVINDAAYAPIQQVGDKFWIMDSDNGLGSAVSNLFSFDGANLADGAVFTDANGVSYQISYNAGGDPLGTGHDVLLTTTTGEIPEPATILLVGPGALVFLGYLRRRQMR
jgi:autotransporter-associated beta strand protein